MAADIDYRGSFFEYPILTKIQDEPSYETIKTIHDEIKTNAQSVHCNLGGGQHGHLGLTLDTTTYALVSNVAYYRPYHPGTYAPINGGTTAQTSAGKDLHTEQIRLFREVKGIEKALRQQIVTAINPQYLSSLQNRQTNSINATIPEILQHLYDS